MRKLNNTFKCTLFCTFWLTIRRHATVTKRKALHYIPIRVSSVPESWKADNLVIMKLGSKVIGSCVVYLYVLISSKNVFIYEVRQTYLVNSHYDLYFWNLFITLINLLLSLRTSSPSPSRSPTRGSGISTKFTPPPPPSGKPKEEQTKCKSPENMDGSELPVTTTNNQNVTGKGKLSLIQEFQREFRNGKSKIANERKGSAGSQRSGSGSTRIK